jgi:hypothetical protein
VSGASDGPFLGFLGGVLTSGAVAAIITQFFTRSRERAVSRQKIMEFLTERRQQLATNTELLAIIELLERERLEREKGGKTIELLNREKEGDTYTPTRMRKLPAFLEPIGVYLEYNPEAFQRAYQVFAREVGLCANSEYLWLTDDLQPSMREHYKSSPYWTSFRQFVVRTEEILAEQRLPRAKKAVHQLVRRLLSWLET